MAGVINVGHGTKDWASRKSKQLRKDGWIPKVKKLKQTIGWGKEPVYGVYAKVNKKAKNVKYAIW